MTMSIPPMLEIRFPAYTSGKTPRCGPKTTLAGVVYLNLTEAQQASCLSLNLVGSERISLAPEPASDHQISSISGARKPKSVKKVYFNQTSILWGDSKLRATNQLAAGIHMFHFSCEFPRINYPQSKTTAEYIIKYVLQAKLLNPRTSSADNVIATTVQPINYVPETISPPIVSAFDQEITAPYAFCDNAIDAQDNSWVFHVQAAGLQQAFRPGDTVDLQIKVTGQKTLRKAKFSVLEQTDCFYPQVPDPHEEQLDLGRRLWSTQRALCASQDLVFERDSCALVPDLCPDHMNATRARCGSTYYAHIRTQLPRDLVLLHETGYLRFTYFAELTLLTSSSWGSHLRTALVRIPIPIATRVLPENDTAPLSSRIPAGAIGCYDAADDVEGRRGTSASSAHTVVDGISPECGISDGPDSSSDFAALRRGRSIVDLGTKLQNLIPRRTPSSSLGLHSGRLAPRSASHSRALLEQPSWSALDPMPPLPGTAASGHGVHAVPAASTPSSTYSSPLTRPISLHSTEGACQGMPSSGSLFHSTQILSSTQRSTSLAQNPAAAITSATSLFATGGARTGFSLTFLLRLREFYNAEASNAALARLVEGQRPEPNSIIPSAITRASNPAPASLGNSFLKSMPSSRRNSRMSVHSVSGIMSSSECARPQIEAIMISYRDPITSHVVTWSALGQSSRDSSAFSNISKSSYPPSRYSRMSSMSVSSNDTACVPTSSFISSSGIPTSGHISFTKEIAPPLPLLSSSLLTATIEASPAVHCKQLH